MRNPLNKGNLELNKINISSKDGVNVLSCFDGISCGRVALERVGIPVNKYISYEIEKSAIKISEKNYPDIIQCGDVFKADFTKHKDIDLLIGGSPCFVAGTMIRTIDGFKAIEDIKVGDMVLTHKNRYKTVTETMSRISQGTVVVKSENCGTIECTKEHPFYTKEMKRVYDSKRRACDRVLSEDFHWIDPQHFYTNKNNSSAITSQTYLTSVTDNIKKEVEYDGVDLKTNQFSTRHVNTLNLNDENLWYVIGRWVGDGWYSYKYRKKKKLSGIKICCGKHKVDELEEKIKLSNLHYYKNEERTVYKFTITNLELALYMQRFGNGATNKHLASEVFYLPDNLAFAFLDGYFSADGHISDYTYTFSTVSKELAYGIKYMVNKYFNSACSITHCKSHNDVIEGRHVNTNIVYSGMFHACKRKQAHYIVDGSYIFAPYKSVEYLEESKRVYNLSVEEDESYVANGLVVHNCTFWSVAQKVDRRETTSEGFGWELFKQYLRALEESRAKYFIYENNYSMSKDIKNEITKHLGVEPIMINSALVSSQMRKRYYWTNIPGVEQPEDKHILLKDIIESGTVDRDKALCLARRYAGFNGSQSYLCRRYFGKSFGQAVFEGNIEDIKNKWRKDPYFDSDEKNIRQMSLTECERLQTLPDGYTDVPGVSTQMKYEAIGNGWTVDVIAHILSYLKEAENL